MSRAVPLPGLLVGWLLLAAGAVHGAAPSPRTEHGFPLIRTYVPTPSEASPQSFEIARDARGVIYVANEAGVLSYDGAWWRLVPVGEAQVAFSLAAGAGGRVAAGGIDDFGYLAPDLRGTLTYVSLLPRLPAGERLEGQTQDIQALGNGFLFSTAKTLYLWDGERVEVLARFPGDRPFTALFAAGSSSYAWTRDGLFEIRGKRLVPVPGGEVFRGRRIDLLLPAKRGLLISVRGEGLFLFDGGKAVPFAPAASRWAAEKRLLRGSVLPDGRWALGSILGGVLLLRPDGVIDGVIDTTTGLPDDYVAGTVVDREGALWIALNSGLARVEVSSPLTVLDRRTGLTGSIYSVARHGGRMWVGTASGAFVLEPSADGGPAVARPAPGVPPAVWSLLSLGKTLLVGTAFGIYENGQGAPRLIPGTDDATPYVLLRSAIPGRVWVGTDSGLSVLERSGDHWTHRVLARFSEVVSLAEGEEGRVWCGTGRDGIVGVSLEPGAGGAAKVVRVESSEEAAPFPVAGRILVLQKGKLRRLDEKGRRLVEDPATATLELDEHARWLAEDTHQRLWLNTRPFTVAERVGEGWRRRALVEIPARSIDVIVPDADGAVWLTSESGLYRYAGSWRGMEPPLPAPRFSQVTVGRGEVLFGGAPGARPRAAELPANIRHLRIEFAPLVFRPGVRYETRLDPEGDWSATSDAFAELPRLSPGSYIFRVRSLGSAGEVGPEAAWSFRVAPPWYGTGWAMALWIGAAVAAVAGYVRLHHRALRQRAARLEARVEKQTVELRQRVEELRRAQDDLETANARLEELSQQDDLTGLANRRRLQAELASEWSRARRHRLPIAFILLDIDHFKQLNDTRGHREGDLCLAAVGHFLAGGVHLPGSLAARYGGEEFALLLPGMDLPAALAAAEELREGFERLALPHEAAPTGVITASFGVAAHDPGRAPTARSADRGRRHRPLPRQERGQEPGAGRRDGERRGGGGVAALDPPVSRSLLYPIATSCLPRRLADDDICREKAHLQAADARRAPASAMARPGGAR